MFGDRTCAVKLSQEDWNTGPRASIHRLICGADGVAAVPYEKYSSVARVKDVALRVSCRRSHREHFEIVGPDGTLAGKVAPSEWLRLLGKRERQE